MTTQHLTMVGRENDNGIISKTQHLQVIKYLTNKMIHSTYIGKVVRRIVTDSSHKPVLVKMAGNLEAIVRGTGKAIALLTLVSILESLRRFGRPAAAAWRKPAPVVPDPHGIGAGP